MLKRKSMPVQNQSRGQMMADAAFDSCFSPKAKATSFFTAPGLFVGLSKGSSDCDSASSPTSPLELRTFSNLSSSFARSPRSPGLEGGYSPRSWDSSRVGLGLVDSLSDEINPCGKKVLGFSGSKNILLGSQMKINIPIPQTHLDNTLSDDDPLGAGPKSMPNDYGISLQDPMESCYRKLGLSKSMLGSEIAELEHGGFGKIHSCSVGTSSLPLSKLIHHNFKSNSEVFSSDLKGSQFGSPLARGGKDFDEFPVSIPISASEIEMSEDYTCIISHGPNAKTTHIFGDRILESHTFHSPDHKNMNEKVGEGSPWVFDCTLDSPPHTSNDFLSFCFFCKKKLEEGEDIYIYRGEKAFCSCDCRDQEILIEEEIEKGGSSFEEEILF